jgi:hypothetical protein
LKRCAVAAATAAHGSAGSVNRPAGAVAAGVLGAETAESGDD